MKIPKFMFIVILTIHGVQQMDMNETNKPITHTTNPNPAKAISAKINWMKSFKALHFTTVMNGNICI